MNNYYCLLLYASVRIFAPGYVRTADTLDTITQYGTGPTTVQVDYGLLVHWQCVGIIILSSESSAQMCSEQAGDCSSSSKE